MVINFMIEAKSLNEFAELLENFLADFRASAPLVQKADSPAATPNGKVDPPAEPTAPKGKRAKKDPPEKSLDDIIKELTALYTAGGQDVRDKIVRWRDGQGVKRLRDLTPEQLPEAAALLTALQV